MRLILERMSKDDRINEREICIHIFSVSAAMVGVCLTVIGILKAISEMKAFTTIGDDALALDALLFLIACIFAYAALRSRMERRRHMLEKVADTFFITALTIMAFVCCFIVYSVI